MSYQYYWSCLFEKYCLRRYHSCLLFILGINFQYQTFTMNCVDTVICSFLCKVKWFQRSDGRDPIWGYLPRGFIMLAVVERLPAYWYYHIISMTANTRRYHNGGLMLAIVAEHWWTSWFSKTAVLITILFHFQFRWYVSIRNYNVYFETY